MPSDVEMTGDPIRIQHPEPLLGDFVDYYWYLNANEAEHRRELSLPDGSIDIIFNLGNMPMRFYDTEHRLHLYKSSVLCGPHSQYFSIDAAGEGKVVGIHIKPGGLRPFMRGSMNEVHNRLLPLDLVWGSLAIELHERLLEQRQPLDMFRILDRSLPGLACSPLVRSREIEYIRMNLLSHNVHDLVEQQGMSHRWLNHKFKEEIGLTPKAMSRILRFQQALQLIHQGRAMDWAELALACGYYDQAHFCREFKAYSGITPGEYIPISGRHRNHVLASE